MASKSANEIKITLTFERSTKNTHLYRAPDGSAIESVYVQKSAMPETAPKTLIISVSY